MKFVSGRIEKNNNCRGRFRVYREALRPFPPSRQAARAAGPKILEEERGQAVNPKGCFSEGSVAEDGDRLSWGVWEAQDPQMVF